MAQQVITTRRTFLKVLTASASMPSTIGVIPKGKRLQNPYPEPLFAGQYGADAFKNWEQWERKFNTAYPPTAN